MYLTTQPANTPERHFANVRHWHLADIQLAPVHVRFRGMCGHHVDLPAVRRNVEAERIGQR
jgi:hypothetical protein